MNKTSQTEKGNRESKIKKRMTNKQTMYRCRLENESIAFLTVSTHSPRDV